MPALAAAQRMDKHINSIAIVGGGLASWMSAAALSKIFGDRCPITVVDTHPGAIGVAGTLPHLKLFNQVLGIDEVEFVKQVQGTFKLGIEFVDWARIGDRYVHGFGAIGHEYGLVPFHQYWLRQFQSGQAEELSHYSLNASAAPAGKFMTSANDVPAHSPLANIAYAYHIDPGLYAAYLRTLAQGRSVRVVESPVVSVTQRGADGFIEALVLANGESVAADLFIDCSATGRLIEQVLQSGFEDWSAWLPCDRIVSVSSEKAPLPACTHATARAAGWQWRMPLQHRTSHGYVYASQFLDESAAVATLLSNSEGQFSGVPRLEQFRSGRRRQAWIKNCVAIGAAAGCVEPLHSTALYSIQSGIARLVNLLPDRDFNPLISERYNAQTATEFERIRDFLILHYCTTGRDDSPLWEYCRSMSLPARLREYIDLFRDSGRFSPDVEEVFALPSWVQVMIGQRVLPIKHHPVADLLGEKEIAELVGGVKNVVAACVTAMPLHQSFIDRFCPAKAS